MANKSFNFGKMKRSFYTTTLKDGKVVIVNMPKKSTFEKMQEISDMDEEEVDGKEVYKTMLSLMAEILSNNKNGERKSKSTTLMKSWHTLTIMVILSIRLRITQIKNAVLSGRRQRGRGAL